MYPVWTSPTLAWLQCVYACLDWPLTVNLKWVHSIFHNGWMPMSTCTSAKLATCILVCLLKSRLLLFHLLNIFYIYCSIVIKFRFTKLLHVFVEVLVVFLETSTDIILCTNTKIFSWKHFVVGYGPTSTSIKLVKVDHPSVIRERWTRSARDNSREVFKQWWDEYISALSTWVGFRRFKLVCINGIFYSTLNCRLNLSRVWLTTAKRSKNIE